MTQKELAEEIYGRMDAKYKSIGKAEDVEDFLSTWDIEYKDIKDYKESGNDFWNDKSNAGHYWCDISSEWADGKVHIYNKDLWDSAEDFEEWIEQSISEFGNAADVIKERGLVGLFAQGECFFWNGFAGNILSTLKEFIEETELK